MEKSKSKIGNLYKNNKKFFYIGVFLIVLFLIIISNKKEDTTLIRGSVAVGEVSSVISLSGKVEATDGVSLRFNTPGVISDINVKVGQNVREGERLMSLDSRSLQADLQKAEANLELIKAESKVSNAGLDRAVESAYVELLNNDLQAYPKDSEKDYDTTPPVIVGSYLGKKEGTYEIEVYGSSAPSGISFRHFGIEDNGVETVNQYSLSKLGNNGLYLQFDPNGNYRNTNWIIPIPNTRSSTYSLVLNKYKNALANRDAAENSNISVEISNAKVKQAEAEISRILADINERIIRAPFSGTVSFIGPNKGEIANSSEIAISLISEDSYEIKIQIPEVDLSKISTGQTASIELDAYPGEKFSGYVASIDPAESVVDGVSVYKASIYLNEQNSKIKSGMTANVSVSSDKKENVLKIGKQFIQTDEMGEYVFVYMNEEQVKTYIETGFVGSDGFVEVVSGLRLNDIIIAKFE